VTSAARPRDRRALRRELAVTARWLRELRAESAQPVAAGGLQRRMVVTVTR
jgi:hypothetical protein